MKQYLEEVSGLKIPLIRRFQHDANQGKKLHWWVITSENKENITTLRQVKEYQGGCITWEPRLSKGRARCYNSQELFEQAGVPVVKINLAARIVH